jgi:hypothetical protein
VQRDRHDTVRDAAEVVVHHTHVAAAGAIAAGTWVRFTLEHLSTGLHAVDVHAI